MRRRKLPRSHFYKTVDLKTLRGVLDYDPETGSLRFRSPENPDGMNAAIVAYAADRDGEDAATCSAGDGRRGVLLCGVVFAAPRLIWAMHYGRWPSQVFSCRDYNNLSISNLFASKRNVPKSRIMEFNP